MRIDRLLFQRKREILEHYRFRAEESLAVITQKLGAKQFKKRASAINSAIKETKDKLIANVRQVAQEEQWTNEELLNNVLMLTYCCDVIMLEFRNSVWRYDYMAFSRRIGELWEPFCALCFEFPSKKGLRLFVPPLFEDVRKSLKKELEDYIAALPLSSRQKSELLRYYEKVWTLVSSGEIKLELDLHVALGQTKYVMDFKSGFSSNEKGNTNRLLLVASVYKNLEAENYRCMIFVRQKEDENNHYLQTLKRSGLWEVYCGPESYRKIREMSGFDLDAWLRKHVSWKKDLSSATFAQFKEQGLIQYLKW
jgi:hypothetical protein